MKLIQVRIFIATFHQQLGKLLNYCLSNRHRTIAHYKKHIRRYNFKFNN